jgi:hypothetical protein
MPEALPFTLGPEMRPAPERLRLPSWADAAAVPELGQRCSVCWGPWWWTEAEAPRRGWRCSCCHPTPTGLRVTEVET